MSAKAWSRFGAGGVAVWLLIGCAPDPRISVAAFIQLQKQYEASSNPSETEPGTSATGQPSVGDGTTSRVAGYDAIDKALGPYRLGPGDTLAIHFNGTDLPFPTPLNARVDRNGRILLPMAGEIDAGNKELEDVERAIIRAYVPKLVKDVAVHAEVVSYDTTNVMVLGAVQNPGFAPLRRTERNMLFAVVMAGGITHEATGRAILRRLRRPGEEVAFDLTNPDDLRASLILDPLQEGDVINVEATPNMVFVGGLVNAGGAQMYDPGVRVNLLQALAAAGGLRTDLTPREGTLIRRMPDGKDVQVKIDLDNLGLGREPNLTLVSGDIFWVPYTAETRVQEFINRNFFLRFGAAANVSYNVTGIEFMNRRSLQTSRAGGNNLQDTFDPFGYLIRNSALQNIGAP